MSSLARPWRRWAVAAPTGTFVIAVFVLAPGGIPAIGMPGTVEVGAGTPIAAAPGTAQVNQGRPHSATSGSGVPTSPGEATSIRTGPSRGPRGASAPSDSGVTVVSAQHPVVVLTGGEPGDDGGPTPTPSQAATPTSSPSPSSWGGRGPGDE